MKLSPRYEEPAIISIAGSAGDCAVPVARQRRRLETLLRQLDAEQWQAPSRCEGWSVHDVVAHLVGVNAFWSMSVGAGLTHTPTRVLEHFDPAATPPLMVAPLRGIPTQELLAQFVTTNDQFLEPLAHLDAPQWNLTAESPAGHVSIRLLAYHALWDSWIHERDIAVPLGLATELHDDEVNVCLRYAAAISPALALSTSSVEPGTYAVASRDPVTEFVLEVSDSVRVHGGTHDADTAVLEGNAVDLIEALSLRAPLLATAPAQWHTLLAGLAAAFDIDR